MKHLTCEMCGSNEFVKQDGVFVCQSCGTQHVADTENTGPTSSIADVLKERIRHNQEQREALLDTIWAYEYRSDIRTVDVHIRRLREKLEENPAEPQYIMTKWGVGYYFRK